MGNCDLESRHLVNWFHSFRLHNIRALLSGFHLIFSSDSLVLNPSLIIPTTCLQSSEFVLYDWISSSKLITLNSELRTGKLEKIHSTFEWNYNVFLETGREGTSDLNFIELFLVFRSPCLDWKIIDAADMNLKRKRLIDSASKDQASAVNHKTCCSANSWPNRSTKLETTTTGI